MSTRAMYTFKDELSTVHVYRHCDGYPDGGLSWIANARKYAWPLPRFEADEFAAAFVAANKDSSGGVRLCGPHIKEPWQMACDAAYWYIVTINTSGKLHVVIHETSWWDEPKSTQIFASTLDKAIIKFGASWAEPVAA